MRIVGLLQLQLGGVHAPRMATHEGHKTVAMFDAIARGEIKALWVMATNPAVSLPRAGAVREALKTLELFVVSENVRSNDTVNAGAHVLLPAAAWAEKEGTVTNSERRISRQRPFLPLPGEAKPDWWIVSEVARRMGFEQAFNFSSAADIFREHAALSGFENGGARDFDLGALAQIGDDAYNGLDPLIWPVRDEAAEGTRFFARRAWQTGYEREFRGWPGLARCKKSHVRSDASVHDLSFARQQPARDVARLDAVRSRATTLSRQMCRRRSSSLRCFQSQLLERRIAY